MKLMELVRFHAELAIKAKLAVKDIEDKVGDGKTLTDDEVVKYLGAIDEFTNQAGVAISYLKGELKPQ